jgi:hypothetical protein
MAVGIGSRRRWLAPTILLLHLCAACDIRPPARFVDGPETAGLRNRLHGVLVGDEDRAIVAYALPDCARRVVRPPPKKTDSDWPFLHAVSAPDRSGLVAFVQGESGEFKPSRHRLLVIKIDGTCERQLWDRPGDAIWDHVIGKRLALSPVGRQIAYVTNMHGAQMPMAYLQEGPLEICSAIDGSVHTAIPAALDNGVEWLADGRRLVYTALVPREEAPPPATPLDSSDDFEERVSKWPRIPVTFVLDTRTGQSQPLCRGWYPIVADDGKSILLWSPLRRVWLDDGRSEPVHLPGGVLALLADGTVIFSARPTKGTAPAYTKGYSPLMGPRQLPAIKVGELSSNRFETLLSSFDLRCSLNYGVVDCD